MIQEGLNAGVTGLLCLQGQSGVKFVGDALGWESGFGVGVFDDAGRADSVWGNKIPLTAGGTITLKGMTNLDGQPIPNDYRGERGTLILTQTTGVTMTLTVMVTNSKFVKPAKEDQLWDFIHVCSIIAAPTLAGWTGTNAAAAQSFTDKELWANLSKTVDLQGLASGASQRWRVWAIGDNDSAEKTKIDSHLAALVAPFTGMKLRPSTFTRLSSNVCLIDVAWGVRNTKDDIEMPGTVTGNDNSDLEDTAIVTKVNASSTPPGVPSAPIGQHLGTDSTQLDDTNWKHIFHYGNTTPKQRVEFQGAIEVDPSGLTDADRQTIVNESSTPPATPATEVSGTKLRRRVSTRIGGTPEKWSHTFIFDRRTTQDDVEMDGSSISADPSLLKDETIVTLVQASGTPTPPGSPPAGLVLADTRTKQRHDGKWAHSFVYRETTAHDDETFPKTRYQTDGSTLEQEDSIAVLFVTGTTPTPPTRSGMVVTGFYDVPVSNALASNLSCRVYQMSYVTNAQKVTLPRYELATDPNDLDTKARSAVIFTTGSPPGDPALTGDLSGLKLLAKTDVSVNTHPTLRVRIYTHAKNDSSDNLLLPRTTFEATSFLAQRAVNASLITTTNVASVTGNSVFLSFKDQVTFESVSAVKTDPDHTLQLITTQVAAKIVEGESTDSCEIITPAFWDGADVWVYMLWKLKVGTNLWEFFLAEQYYEGQKICFTITQRVSGSTLPYYTNLLNTKNGATFFGFAAGYVRYRGVAKSMTNMAVASNRVSEITWRFEYDSLGIIKMADASPGKHWTNTDLTSVGPSLGPGWVKASDLGLSADVRADGDYSVFA